MAAVEFDKLGRLVLAGRSALNALLLNAVIVAAGVGATVEQTLPTKNVDRAGASREVAPSTDVIQSKESPSEKDLTITDVEKLMRNATPVGENKVNAMCVC